MTVDRSSKVTQLPGTVGAERETVRTDRQLLEDYVLRHDEAALEALVRRHGPMVWGVCRRTLFDHHDAEDAFQATFLVLVRRAASIASPELLANWLYGVAYQTALKGRATAARRRAREKLMAEVPEPSTPPRPAGNDLPTCLDRELNSLPAKYRAPIVLCDVEGKTRQEAARELDWPEGTVAGRLARAREMLAQRLLRRGVVLPAGLAAGAALGDVPPALMIATVKAASLFAAGRATASASVAALAQGVLDSMWLARLKGMAALTVAVLGVAVALGWLLLGAPNRHPDEQEGGKVVKLGAKADSNGFSVESLILRGKQVDFMLSYGSDVEGVQQFHVQDEEGRPLWIVSGSGQNGIRKITYGVPPFDRSYLGGRPQQQGLPTGNKPPEDIIGKEIRIKAHYRFKSLFGPGIEIYEATVAVPAN